MKKRCLFLLLTIIAGSSYAQQTAQLYTMVQMADTAVLYDITLQLVHPVKKSALPKAGQFPVSKINFKTLTKAQYKPVKAGDTYELFYDSERKWYSYSGEQLAWEDVLVITIATLPDERQQKPVVKRMKIVVPMAQYALWTELFLMKIVFEPGKVIDLLNKGELQELDNTVKVVLQAGGKQMAKSRSAYAPGQ